MARIKIKAKQDKIREQHSAKQALLERHGLDKLEDGTHVAFKKKFQGKDEVYEYSATKARGMWFRSGDGGERPMMWSEMLAFMEDRNVLPPEQQKILVAVEFVVYSEAEWV